MRKIYLLSSLTLFSFFVINCCKAQVDLNSRNCYSLTVSFPNIESTRTTVILEEQNEFGFWINTKTRIVRTEEVAFDKLSEGTYRASIFKDIKAEKSSIPDWNAIDNVSDKIELACTNNRSNYNSNSDNLSNRISVFPNPSRDFINIVQENETGDFTVTIYSIQGQQLNTVSNKSEINVSEITSGIYLLKFVSEAFEETTLITISH